MAYSEATNNSTTRKGQALYTSIYCLHNFLRTEESSVYCPPGFIDSEDGTGNVLDGRWRADVEGSSGMLAIPHTGSNRYVNNVTP